MSVTQTLRGQTTEQAPVHVPVAPVLLPVQPNALPDLVRRSYDAVHALGGGTIETTVDATGADYFFDSLCDEILPPHILILGNSPAQSHRDH